MSATLHIAKPPRAVETLRRHTFDTLNIVPTMEQLFLDASSNDVRGILQEGPLLPRAVARIMGEWNERQRDGALKAMLASLGSAPLKLLDTYTTITAVAAAALVYPAARKFLERWTFDQIRDAALSFLAESGKLPLPDDGAVRGVRAAATAIASIIAFSPSENGSSLIQLFRDAIDHIPPALGRDGINIFHQGVKRIESMIAQKTLELQELDPLIRELGVLGYRVDSCSFGHGEKVSPRATSLLRLTATVEKQLATVTGELPAPSLLDSPAFALSAVSRWRKLPVLFTEPGDMCTREDVALAIRRIGVDRAAKAVVSEAQTGGPYRAEIARYSLEGLAPILQVEGSRPVCDLVAAYVNGASPKPTRAYTRIWNLTVLRDLGPAAVPVLFPHAFREADVSNSNWCWQDSFAALVRAISFCGPDERVSHLENLADRWVAGDWTVKNLAHEDMKYYEGLYPEFERVLRKRLPAAAEHRDLRATRRIGGRK